MFYYFEGLLQFLKDEDFSIENLRKYQSKFLIITLENDKRTGKTFNNETGIYLNNAGDEVNFIDTDGITIIDPHALISLIILLFCFFIRSNPFSPIMIIQKTIFPQLFQSHPPLQPRMMMLQGYSDSHM